MFFLRNIFFPLIIINSDFIILKFNQQKNLFIFDDYRNYIISIFVMIRSIEGILREAIHIGHQIHEIHKLIKVADFCKHQTYFWIYWY